MIEGINLTKKFGDRLLFDNLCFTIKTGEFVCFSGESGKGKTTLLNMIGQIEPPTSGQIRYDGKEVRTSRDRLVFLATKVGFIFQNFALVEGKTVSQNLEFVKKRTVRTYPWKRRWSEWAYPISSMPKCTPSPAANSRESPWPDCTSKKSISSWPMNQPVLWIDTMQTLSCPS